MSLRITLIAMSVLFVSTPASASIEWDIQCDAAQTNFEVTLDIFNQYVQEGDVTGYELLFEQSAVGTCDAPEVFMTVPLHSPLTYAQYSFTRPVPEMNRYYRFRVLMKWPDGTVLDVGFPGAPSWNVASCGEAVAARGYLANPNEYGDVELFPCPNSCGTWPCTMAVNMSQIPEEQWMPLVGTNIPVDIYGRFVRYPMPGGPCLVGEDWLPTSSEDCGPVAVEGESWGSLKARYR
jgi:hypothetical protein